MCRHQQPIVDRLSNDPRFANVVVFKIDFDSGKDYLRQLKVTSQGTLIAFKGKVEKARSVGELDPNAIRKVFESAL
jgi:thioredoxin 1